MYIDELFDRISRLPADEREDALARDCVGQPMVEAQVRALLSAHTSDDGRAAAPLDRIPLAAGSRLGPFELVEAIGQGATASVWKAWDTHLQTYTALKLLHAPAHLDGDRGLEAVLHEARAAVGILSDHVVRIRTAGRFEGGQTYIEMELCAERRPGPDGEEVLEIGRSLSEVPLHSLVEKVRVISEAARGVDAAHRAGVLHRDIKPGNILLTPVARRAKVTDFGLAAEQGYPAPLPSDAVDRTVTILLEASDGRVVGTPAYMPPEQAFGHPATRATDVYGLGATLYALLVGEHPYEARSDAAVPALDVLAQVRAGPPMRLSRRTRVPRRLERIVRKAMARSARVRYATAGDLADDLDAWMSGHATRVDGPAPLLRSGLFVARHRTLAITVTALVGILMVFAGGLGWLDLTRRSLEASIATSQVELALSRHMATIAALDQEAAEAERERALAETQAAKVESNNANLARQDADDQRKDAVATMVAAQEQRDHAEVARRQAEEARILAEEAQLRAEDSRRLAEVALLEKGLALSDLEAQHASLQEALAASRSRIAAQDVDLATERANLARLNRAYESEQQARAETDEKLAEAKQQLRAARRKVRDLEGDLTREQRVRQDLEDELADMSTLAAALRGDGSATQP